MPTAGYVDTGGAMFRYNICVTSSGPADLHSPLKAHVPFMIPRGFETPPSDLADTPEFFLHDLHWEALVAVVFAGLTDMVDFVPVADLPTLVGLADQVADVCGWRYPVSSRSPLSRTGDCAEFGA